jgi:hypothetical protein
MSGRIKEPPSFASEAEERAFWETHDSTDYLDWSQAQRVRFPNLRPSTTVISPSACGARRNTQLAESLDSNGSDDREP